MIFSNAIFAYTCNVDAESNPHSECKLPAARSSFGKDLMFVQFVSRLRRSTRCFSVDSRLKLLVIGGFEAWAKWYVWWENGFLNSASFASHLSLEKASRALTTACWVKKKICMMRKKLNASSNIIISSFSPSIQKKHKNNHNSFITRNTRVVNKQNNIETS